MANPNNPLAPGLNGAAPKDRDLAMVFQKVDLPFAPPP